MNRVKDISFLISLLAWLAFAPATMAQYRCQVRVPATHGPIQNYFVAFSNFGGYCTAGTLENADTLGPNGTAIVRIIFQHSTDGGMTWQRQDPGLPIRYVDNQYQLRAIDQIDSVNEVMIGDTGVVLRTSNGGETWTRQSLPSSAVYPLAVSFVNSREGILTVGDTLKKHVDVFVTSDGGTHWSESAFAGLGLFAAKAYGNGKFRLYEADYGVIYTTLDNFQTVDSTKPIFDSIRVINGHARILGSCKFGAGDTMIAYGGDIIGDTTNALIWRTSDGGKSWAEVFDSDYVLHGVSCMSDVNRDTMLAGCTWGSQKILLSNDHGATWKIDTLLFDSVDASHSITNAFSCRGIGLTPSGNIVGAFGFTISSLITGQWAFASVPETYLISNDASIYPNPATTMLRLDSFGRNFLVLDPLGRLYDCLRTGSTLDVSRLPAGVYFVSDGGSTDGAPHRARFVKE